MKKWFLSLESKKQNIFIAISWGIVLLCCLFIAISPSTSDNLSAFDYFLVFLLIGAVIISVFLSSWKSKAKKRETTKSQTDWSGSVDKAFGLDRANETVKVYFEDGSFEEHKTYQMKVSDPEWCLVVDGGKTYHLRFDCFHKWSEEYQKNFVAWKAIKLKDAIDKGYTLCRFCEKADEPLSFDEIDKEDDDSIE